MFLLLLYPMEQVLQANIPQLGGALWLTNVIVGLLVLLGAFRAFLAPPLPITGYFNAGMITTILLYLWAMGGVLLSPDIDASIEKVRSAIPYFTLLLVFPTLLVTRLEDWRRLITPTMIAGCVVLVLMLLSPRTYFAGTRLVIDLEDITGGAGNPLATAQLGGLLAIFGVLYRPVSGGGTLLLVRIAAIGLGLGIAALSGSRGQLLAAVGASVVCYPIARQVRNVGQFAGTVVSAGLFVIVGYLVLQRVLSGAAGERWDAEQLQEGIDSRAQFAALALSEWAADPAAWVFGLGTFSSGSSNAALDGTYVHNSIVQALTENGIVGLGLFLLVGVFTAIAGRKLIRWYVDRPEMRSAAACAIAMALYEFALSLKQGDYVATGAPIWAMLIVTKMAAAEETLGVDDYDAEYPDDEGEWDDEGYTEPAGAPHAPEADADADRNG